MKWSRIALALMLVIPSLAFAAGDPLEGVGPLIFTGHGKEAREQLLKARDTFAADGNASQEAATWLLLGLVDVSLTDAEAARTELRQAAAKFTNLNDHFGAWLSLWTIATLEANEAKTSDAIAAYERVLEELREAADPQAKFTLESAKTLAPVFGASPEMLGSLAMNPEILKPILLRFAEIISRDAYAKALLDAGDLEKAEEELGRASEGATLFGGAFDGSIALHYGMLRQQQWRLDEAREQYLKALNGSKTMAMFTPPAAGNDPWMEINVLGNLAELELLSGRLDEALVWNDRALKLARESRNGKREAGVLRDRAELLQKGGRYDDAIPFYDQALDLATKDGDRLRVAYIRGDLGSLHMFRGEYGSAARELEQAIAIYQALDEPYLEAPTWLLLAEVYMLLETDDSITVALDNGRKLAEKSGFTLARSMVDVLEATKRLHQGHGSVADARSAASAMFSMPDARGMFTEGFQDLYRESFSLLPGVPSSSTKEIRPGGPPLLTALAVMLQGKSALERGEFETARNHFKHALSLNPNGEHKAGLLAMIGASYWKEGKADDAIRYFRQSADALDASAADVKVEEMLSGYLGSNRRIYFDVLIEMLVHEGRPMEAFAHAERARARAFLQLVGNHRLNAATNADPRLVAEAENLRAEIAEREQRALSAKPEETARLAADLERARQYYRAVVIRMKTSNPEYADLTNIAPQQIDTIREDLPADATLVSYYVSPHGVHAWVLDRESAHYELLPLDGAGVKRLVCWAHAYGSHEARGVGVRDATCGNQIATPDEAYDKLIAPLRAHILHEKLIIVPHGVLHYIPFAALHDREHQRYLIEDYTLTYAPSASALRFLRAKETPVDGGSLVLGDPTSPLPSLEPLPGAKQEATFVAEILGTTPRLGDAAREALLYGLDGKVDLVHLAAHGMYDAVNPLFSRIALAAGDKQDGSLTVTEILSSVDLKGVNLVVLSACRSAVGQRSGGDEIVGLTRALLYAGTPGVISTLWNIDDAAAAGLMNEFYRKLTGGASAAEALRQAQLSVLRSDVHGDPKYWAAFTLTGDPQGRWTRAGTAGKEGRPASGKE